MTDTSTQEPDRAEPLAFAGIGLGAMALVAAVFAVGVSVRAANEARDALEESRSGAGAAAPAEEYVLSLDEFSIDPGELAVPAGAVLTLDNLGAVTHNLSVDGNASPMIDGGGSAQLDLAGLAPGTYEMRCDVPGHAEAGMTGTITIE